MTTWVEVREGDMQRMQENATMFRCSLQKPLPDPEADPPVKPFAFLCTHLGDDQPFDPERSMECYATDTHGVDWFCADITKTQFDALTQDKVGVDDDTVTPPAPPADDPAVWSIFDPDLGQYYSQELDTWAGIGNATRFTAAEKAAYAPFPPVDHPNADWRELAPL